MINNKIIIELSDEELKILREIWEDTPTKLFFQKLNIFELNTAYQKIAEAIAPPEPEKQISLDDYFKF
ncbi:hypothetical protein [Nostoc sp. CCY 9925]|uniref:hypothetical protein n=1 Tax=Nostoc sp. CCY 9925 TaxID=3103865 RepID=UPI0039C5F5AD